ncbi:MAG: hypothetical protein LBF68_07565, partial [Christensenellaceae bacterium]|nr:hypothetical protein [Christensenellaceae bacterium]
WGFLKRGGGWISEIDLTAPKEPPTEPSFVVYYMDNDRYSWNDFLRIMNDLGHNNGQSEVTVFNEPNVKYDESKSEDIKNRMHKIDLIPSGYKNDEYEDGYVRPDEKQFRAFGMVTNDYVNDYALDDEKEKVRWTVGEELDKKNITHYGDRARFLKRNEVEKPFTEVGRPRGNGPSPKMTFDDRLKKEQRDEMSEKQLEENRKLHDFTVDKNNVDKNRKDFFENS